MVQRRDSGMLMLSSIITLKLVHTLATAATEGERGVLLVFDLDERVEHHGTALVQVDLERLERGLLLRFVRVL